MKKTGFIENNRFFWFGLTMYVVGIFLRIISDILSLFTRKH